jgi:hypothetical protein
MGRCFVIVLALVSGACADDHGEPFRREPTFEQAAARMAEVACQSFRVCVAEHLGAEFAEHYSGARCIYADRDRIRAGIDAGTVLFHPERVPGCLAALERDGCALLRGSGPSECESVVEELGQ